jgi:hypothetical protein
MTSLLVKVWAVLGAASVETAELPANTVRTKADAAAAFLAVFVEAPVPARAPASYGWWRPAIRSCARRGCKPTIRRRSRRELRELLAPRVAPSFLRGALEAAVDPSDGHLLAVWVVPEG